MARPQKNRKVSSPPIMKGFKPFGLAFCETENIIMKYDEYETIRLLNYNFLSQIKAAEQMNISRPTLTRVYNSALKKIANAFIEGKSIVIEGGNFNFEKNWFKCKKCFRLIEGIENHVKCKDCNMFGKEELINLNNVLTN